MFIFNHFVTRQFVNRLSSITGQIFLCLSLVSCLESKPVKEPPDTDKYSDIDTLATAETTNYSAENITTDILSSDSFELDEFILPEVQDTTIWPRIRNGFQLETPKEHKWLTAEMRWYKKNTNYLNRVMKRSEPFLHYILEEAERLDLPTELVLLPIVESAFQPFAYSHGRAAGLWQFIPSTGKLYGLRQDWWYDGRRDIHASTQAALKYLNNLNTLFKGNWLHALAAYNSGPGTVQKAIKRNKRLNRPTDFWHLKLPLETRAYVPKLLALKELISNPEEHEVTLRCIQDIPGFVQVDTGSQLDLALAAELADINVDTLYEYNPAFNRWATSPNGPHKLLLPAEAAETFTENLALLDKSKRIKWKRHKIKEGETLSHIAVKYNSTVKHLRKTNNLRRNSIRTGKYLLIPLASENQSHYSLSANQRKKSIQSTKQSGRKTIHTVKNGESFWLIARRYDVSMHKLAKWNGMAVRDQLKIGQKLVIWIKNSDKSTNISRISNKPSNTVRSISYTVRNGDSLSLIAARYRVSVNDLHKWNKIKGKYLQPGQRLRLYVDITNQSGESG